MFMTISLNKNWHDYDDNDDNVNDDDYNGDDFNMSFKKIMIFW